MYADYYDFEECGGCVHLVNQSSVRNIPGHKRRSGGQNESSVIYIADLYGSLYRCKTVLNNFWLSVFWSAYPRAFGALTSYCYIMYHPFIQFNVSHSRVEDKGLRLS